MTTQLFPIDIKKQEGDVLLIKGVNGATITVKDGFVEMSAGYQTTALIALFGGKIGDDGISNTKTWRDRDWETIFYSYCSTINSFY